jgi:hypothetical protein
MQRRAVISMRLDVTASDHASDMRRDVATKEEPLGSAVRRVKPTDATRKAEYVQLFGCKSSAHLLNPLCWRVVYPQTIRALRIPVNPNARPGYFICAAGAVALLTS